MCALQVIATDGNVVTNMERCATDIPLKQFSDGAEGGGGQKEQCCIKITSYLIPQFSNPEQSQS
jgi:hypothetical protein